MSLGSTFSKNADLAASYGDNKSTAAGWPTSVIARLYVGNPTSGGVEMSGGGYSGVTVANTTANMGTPSGGTLTPGVITFPTSTGPWSSGAPPTYWAFTDGSGNLLDTGTVAPNPGITASGQVATLNVTITAS